MPATTAAERLSSFGQQDGEAALPLHQRGHVRLAVLLAEDQQVALPVPEGLPVADLRRPVLDPALARDRRATGPAAVAAPTSAARLRQLAGEALLAALRGVEWRGKGSWGTARPPPPSFFCLPAVLCGGPPPLCRPPPSPPRAG